jgi:choline dehydrogenase-like flavoprotein
MTWAILKAHTENRAGTVTLRSADPRDMPHVNFRYFEEGSDTAGADLEAVVNGVEFARKLVRSMGDVVEAEVIPGPAVETREQIRDFVRKNAWGHHASCSCPIGKPDDPMAVVDGDFRVYGTKGLRVVDASVFPRIPGFFVVSAVYMVSEKATDVILRDARAGQPSGRP